MIKQHGKVLLKLFRKIWMAKEKKKDENVNYLSLEVENLTTKKC